MNTNTSKSMGCASIWVRDHHAQGVPQTYLPLRFMTEFSSYSAIPEGSLTKQDKLFDRTTCVRVAGISSFVLCGRGATHISQTAIVLLLI